MMLDLFAPKAQPKTLRQHQVKSIDLLRQSIGAGNRRVMLQLPTGAGKTLVAQKICSLALLKGGTAAFTVPAISLIDQTVKAFAGEGLDQVGVIQANHPLTDYDQPVQVCSVQTLARRAVPDVNLVLVDEAHLQFDVIYDWMQRCPDLVFVGLSATPWTTGLGEHWQDLVAPTTMRDLIDLGYLSDYSVYAPSSPDLSGVKTVAGDYQQDQLSAIMQDAKIVGDVVQSWIDKGNDDPTLCFAVDRAHARAIQAKFARAGIRFGYCDANVDIVERSFLFDQLERREISGIVNVGTLTTGVDADIRTLILARPTKSESLFVQIIGRALRPAEGKGKAVIIDHTDTTLRLGMPCTIHHEKLDTGEKKRSSGSSSAKPEPKPKKCPKCERVKPVGEHICLGCGFEPIAHRDVETAEGELTEIKKAKPKFTMADKQRWFSELNAIAEKRGKSSGWVSHTYREKFGIWPRGLMYLTADPSPEVLGFVRAKARRYAKKMKAGS